MKNLNQISQSFNLLLELQRHSPESLNLATKFLNLVVNPSTTPEMLDRVLSELKAALDSPVN